MTALFVDTIFIALFIFYEENDYNKYYMLKPLTQLESNESKLKTKIANRGKPFFIAVTSCNAYIYTILRFFF